MRAVGLLALAVLLAACAGPSAFQRGLAHLRAGQYAEARQAFDEAIFEAQDSPAAHTNRGIARARLGDLAGAIEDYTRALALVPDDAATLLNRGNAQVRMRDYPAAIADY